MLTTSYPTSMCPHATTAIATLSAAFLVSARPQTVQQGRATTPEGLVRAALTGALNAATVFTATRGASARSARMCRISLTVVLASPSTVTG